MARLDQELAKMVQRGAASEHAGAALAREAALAGVDGEAGAPVAASGDDDDAVSRSLRMVPFFLTALDGGATAPVVGGAVSPSSTVRGGGVSRGGVGGGGLGAPAGNTASALPPAPAAAAGDPIIAEQRRDRLARARMALVDQALATLHGLPGGGAGLPTRARDAASVVTGASPPRGSSASVAFSAVSRPTSAGSYRSGATAATSASSLHRRLTARDIRDEAAAARRQLLATSSSSDTKGEPGSSGGSDAADGAALATQLAPRSDIERLLAELRDAGAEESLPSVLEPSAGAGGGCGMTSAGLRWRAGADGSGGGGGGGAAGAAARRLPALGEGEGEGDSDDDDTAAATAAATSWLRRRPAAPADDSGDERV